MKNGKRNKKQKVVGIKQLKIIAMSKYFKRINIIFVVEVVIIFFLTFSYFFVLVVFEEHYESKILDFDYTVNEIEGIYKAGFENLLLLKDVTKSIIEFEIEKEIAIDNIINEKKFESVQFNGKFFSEKNISLIENEVNNNVQNPSSIKLIDFKLGNMLISILNDNSLDKELQNELNVLYNSDSCSIFFPNYKDENSSDFFQYDQCGKFWSSILMKGMEQSITQMIIEKNSVLDELNSLYRKERNITEIMKKTSAYREFEFFVQFYFLKAFWKTSVIFDQLKIVYINGVSRTYLIIMIAYMIITLILVFVIRAVIASSRRIFNSFLNFIVILPSKFLSDDPIFLEEVLKLEEKLY